MKKILLISNMYPSNKNKHYGIFVKNVEELLRNNEYLVDKVIMTKSNNKFIKLIKYIIFHLKVIFKGLFFKYDYLYVHFVSHSSLGAIIVKKIKKNIKLIFNCHGNDIIVDTNKDLNNIKRSKKYLKYGDKIIAPSYYFKNILINNYDINKNKIFIYPSGGVNTKKFIKKDINTCKKECKLNKNKVYMGYISRIEKDKGWDTYLYMIKELEKKHYIEKYNYRFLLVGSGIEEYNMNLLIDKLNIRQYIDYKKMVSQEELVDLYNCLELYIFPTRRKSDSLGLVGLEAMACETLVITGDKYGPTDYIDDKKNGFAFKSGDYKDLVNKIIEIRKLDEKELNNIKKEARITALKYDVEKTKDKILEVFK